MEWEIAFNPQLGELNNEIWRLIIEIEAYKRSTLRLPLPPQMREQINQINIVRQIKGTTGIEGNTLTEEEITKIITKPQDDQPTEPGPVALEEREIINAKRVLEYIRDHSQLHPGGFIDEAMIKSIHRLTTEGCGYEGNVPGIYRNHRVHAGEYTPPGPEKIPGLMAQFMEFINGRPVAEKYGPLIRAILAHFYLISIHPFGDGNGRTSRGIEAYILYSGGYNVRGFYSLANYYYKKRDEYIEKLQAARFIHKGRLAEFVQFSLAGFVSELEQVQEEILHFITLLMFKDYVKELHENGRISWRSVALLDYMTKEEKTIKLQDLKTNEHYLAKFIYRKYKGVRTLNRDIKQMSDLDLVKITDGYLQPNIEVMQKFAD